MIPETLHEQRELLREVFAEAVEEVGLIEAIREGQKSKIAQRSDVFDVLEDRA